MRRPTLERFLEKVGPPDANGCLPWIASRQPAGHGQFALGGRPVLAHRFAYESLLGPVADGYVLHHRCGNPACCNVAHLEPVTRAEHVQRHENGNAAKTYCKRGHRLDGTNVRVAMRDGYAIRHCRACQRERQSAYRDRLARSAP